VDKETQPQFIALCCYCRRVVRVHNKSQWVLLEDYLREQLGIIISHSCCECCGQSVLSEL